MAAQLCQHCAELAGWQFSLLFPPPVVTCYPCEGCGLSTVPTKMIPMRFDKSAVERISLNGPGDHAWPGYCKCQWSDDRSRVLKAHPSCKFHAVHSIHCAKYRGEGPLADVLCTCDFGTRPHEGANPLNGAGKP